MEELRPLILKARTGDVEAYGQIVRRFQDMAYGYAYSILGDFQLAEDAAQDAFIQAYRDLPNLREPDAFSGWFRKIVFTHCTRLTRGKRLPTVPLDAAVEVPSSEPSPHEAYEKGEIRHKVVEAIQSLPENERAVTALFYINGYAHDEIASFLEVPVTTVKSRLHTSRNRLKERMLTMVEDYLHENRPTDGFASRVLENIPKLAWGMGKECTFAGGLESALAVTDHPCSYETIMGGTALAFRTRWWKAMDGTGWCPSNPVGEFPEEIEAAGKVTGWPIRIECLLGNPEPHMERFAPDIAASIDKGMPVLGYDEHLNVSVICGYEDKGRTILMRDYFRGDQATRIEAGKLQPFLLFLTDYIGAASREDILKMGLELGVENFHWSEPVPHPNKLGAYRYGKHALAKWAEDIAGYDRYSQAEREKLFFVSWWTFSSMVDARTAAVKFLRGNLDLASGKVRDALTAAADLYQKELDTLCPPAFQAKEAFLGPWSEKSVADWVPQVRQREQELLRQALEIETSAMAHIAEALK